MMKVQYDYNTPNNETTLSVCIYIVKLHSRSSRSIYETEARWGQPMPSKMHRLLSEIFLKF